MDESNYSTWASKTKLWLSRFNGKSHLTTTVESIPTENWEQWIKIDVQLHSIIESTIHTSHRPIFCPHESCASIWIEVRTLYTNGTQRFYVVCQDLLMLLAPWHFDGLMFAYLRRLHAVLHDFNELLPLVSLHWAQV